MTVHHRRTFMPGRTTLFWIIVFCILAADAPVLTGQQLRVPTTLPVSRQRVVVLEFESPDTTRSGRAIGRAVAHALASSLAGVETIRLMSVRDPLEPASRNSATITTLADRSSAVIAVWGEYYNEGETLVIAPHMQIFPRDKMTEKDLGLEYTTEDGVLATAPPTSQINFTPIVLDAAQRSALLSAWTPEVPLRAGQEGDGPSTGTIGAGVDYDITRAAEGAHRVAATNGETGWTPVDAGAATAFARVAQYASGVSQYIAGDYDAAKATFDAYSGAHADEDRMNLAFAHLLTGNAMVLAATRQSIRPDHRAVDNEYKAAGALIPNDPTPAEHLALSRVFRYSGPGAQAITDTIPELNDAELALIGAVQQDGGDRSVQNLRTFYKLAHKYNYLRRRDVDERAYTESLNKQLGVLSEIDRRQDFILVIRETVTYPDFLTIRGGLWFPKDVSKSFTFRDSTYSSDKVDQAQAFGLDFHHRSRLAHPLYGDFSIGVWYTTYDFTRSSIVDDPALVKEATSWAVIVPIHLGLSVTPFPKTFIQPYATAGLGGAIALSVQNVKTGGTFARTEENKVQGGFSAYVGVGVDLFITPTFGFSAGVKYNYLKFSRETLTNQRDFSGVQALVGFATRI